VLLVQDAYQTRGFYVFAILNACFYILLLVIIVVQHARENTVRYSTRIYQPALAASLLALIALPSLATAERGRDGIEALAWGTRNFTLFDDRFSVAGAGVGGRNTHKTIFNPRWREGDAAEQSQQ
jgi:cellulose synthase (UDP-forming)